MVWSCTHWIIFFPGSFSMDNFWFLEHFLIFLSKSEYYPFGFLPVSSGGIFYPAESRDNESPMFAASLNVQRSVTDIVNVLQLIMNVGHERPWFHAHPNGLWRLKG